MTFVLGLVIQSVPPGVSLSGADDPLSTRQHAVHPGSGPLKHCRGQMRVDVGRRRDLRVAEGPRDRGAVTTVTADTPSADLPVLRSAASGRDAVLAIIT